MTLDVQTLITNAQKRADDLTTAAMSAAQSVPISTTQERSPYKTAITPHLRGAPPAFTGNIDITAEILRVFQDGFNAFKPEMLEGLADFIARFYPECVFSTTENWICNTILYGGTGIPADVEAQIYNRAKSREIKEAAKMAQVATIQFANRGFQLPSGALTARLLEVQQDADDKISTINRDIMVKQVEIEIENIKFAIDQGVKIRVSILSAISEYLKAYLLPISLANERATAMANAKGILLNSSADYYRAMIAEAELVFKAEEINSTSYNALVTTFMQTYQRATEANSSTGASVANSLAQVAAQASGSALTLAAQEETAINNA